MRNHQTKRLRPAGIRPNRYWPFLIIACLLASLLTAAPADAQGGNTVTETVVSPNSQRVWKTHKDGIEQGSDWRQLGFDDSAWEDETMKFYESHGTVRGNGYYAYYFREEFEITDTFQISDLELDLYYDDAAVVYLNGTEIYRSIRNNLPSVDDVPVGDIIPVDYIVSVGGAEDYYVQIPADSNYCEQGCINDGATDPVDASLLVEGTNVFAVMAWTRPTSDLGFDLGIDVVRDLDAPLPDQININELMSSNSTVQDEDGDTPDWFELYNPGVDPVSINGWIVEDSTSNWSFPDVTIPAGDYLRVFASGKDRKPTDGSNLHTAFKLSKEADSLRLIDANNIVRDAWDVIPRQIADVAWGRALDGDTITYLASATPGVTNSDASTALPPVLRPFSNRLFNVGDPVDLQIDAFDPEGEVLSYAMANNQSVTVDAVSGAITGTATAIGEFAYTILVTDVDNQVASQLVRFTVVEEAAPATPLVLNEYNAVAPNRELSSGSDVAFGQVLGNGGDWYEFVVVDELLDLRGWTLQFWDRDRADAILDRAASLTFGDDFLLAALPAGTIITISEDRPDDLSFDPANGDWTLNLRSNTDNGGAMFAVQESFNSTRDDQHVEIRNADGDLMSPIVGETEAWDIAAGGVNGGEVMNLCIDPAIGDLVDPATDYFDNAVSSTYSAPNECEYLDPNDPNGVAVVSFTQDFAALRATAGLRGDVNCDNTVNVVDSLLIAQYSVGNRTDAGSCPLNDPATEINASNGDFNVESGANVVDSLLIAKCSVGAGDSTFCN
jgi:hypothetical protein